MAEAKRRLRASLPEVRVEPAITDYLEAMPDLRRFPGAKLILFIGSSIGNFEPGDDARLLTSFRTAVSPGDALLLGTDLRKHPACLIPAYDDAQGVTARFNKNMLARINRELDGGFDLDTFGHVVRWNPRCSRVEMYLESLHDQVVPVRSLATEVRFAQEELLHTENSYKYTLQYIRGLLADSGFELERTWTDTQAWYAVHLARVR
mgnify:FL=1